MSTLLTSAPRISKQLFFFFNDTATTEIYTLSLHDALPISYVLRHFLRAGRTNYEEQKHQRSKDSIDRKSTRLNSSHSQISYAVFCLKKKKRATSTPATSSTCKERNITKNLPLLAMRVWMPH